MMRNTILQGFKHVEDQIGYCGIWCGSCMAGNGALQALTARYAETITAYGLKTWAPEPMDYEAFDAGLHAIQAMPLCAGCLKGGGRDDCEIRACALGRGLTACSHCEAPAQCEHAELLEQMRTGAREAGLFVASESADRARLLQTWTAALKDRWPSLVLFLADH